MTKTLSPDKQATRVLDFDFLSAVKVGRKSVSTKLGKSLPVLGCVLVKKMAHRVEVISTDLETVSRGLTQTFYSSDDPAVCGVDFSVCVPQKPLFDWLRALEPRKPTKNHPAQELEVSFEQLPAVNSGTVSNDRQWLKVKAGNTTARFYGIMADEFPLLDGRIPAEGVLENFKLAEQ